MNTVDERRRFFRVKDEIILDIECIEEKDLQKLHHKIQKIPARSELTITTELNILSNEFLPVLNKIRKDTPDIGQYLDMLNKKIDAIAQVLSIKEGHLDEQPRTEVCLSASGIAYNSPEKYKIGQHLDIHLTLFPEINHVHLLGYIHQQEKSEKEGYHTIINFSHINSIDEDLIVKHTISTQMAERRAEMANKSDE